MGTLNTYKAEQSASSKRLTVGQELSLVRAALKAHGIELAGAGDEGFYVRVTTGPLRAHSHWYWAKPIGKA